MSLRGKKEGLTSERAELMRAGRCTVILFLLAPLDLFPLPFPLLSFPLVFSLAGFIRIVPIPVSGLTGIPELCPVSHERQ